MRNKKKNLWKNDDYYSYAEDPWEDSGDIDLSDDVDDPTEDPDLNDEDDDCLNDGSAKIFLGTMVSSGVKPVLRSLSAGNRDENRSYLKNNEDCFITRNDSY